MNNNKTTARIRVCHFITSLQLGGAEKLLLEVARYLNRDKYKLFVVSLLGGELESELRSLGAETYVVGMHFRWDLSALVRLYRYLRKNKIQILHTHLYHPTIIGRIIGHLARVPVIISTYHYSYLYQRRFNMFLDRLTARFSNRIIVVSEASERFCVEEERLPEDRITLIYNGISLDEFDRLDDTEPAPLFNDNFPIVGSIGRLCWDKGYQYLLQAARIILTERPGVHFAIIGDGPMRKELEEESERLGLKDKVLFTGMRKDVKGLLKQFDIFVLSSVNEGLPIALLEAMANLKPVAVTDAGGCREVVNHQLNGLVVPREDSEKLAQAIKLLLTDKDLSRRLAEAGRQRVKEKFNARDMVMKIDDVYDRANVK